MATLSRTLAIASVIHTICTGMSLDLILLPMSLPKAYDTESHSPGVRNIGSAAGSVSFSIPVESAATAACIAFFCWMAKARAPRLFMK